jgi:hypothetical protein
MIHTGPYRTVLEEVFGDVLITDPPYTERCHSGQSAVRGKIGYSPWTIEDYHLLLWWAEKHVRGWWVIMTDHCAWRWIDDWMREDHHCERFAFAPVPIVTPGSTCRFNADGPASWTVYAHVSRPRTKTWSAWRALPGAYITSAPDDARILGEKSLDLMINLVHDYSDQNMTIIDPCCGTGTTLQAARILGRTGIGAEMDARTAAIATSRLKEAFTPAFL